MVQPPSNFIISSTEAENLANSKNLTLPQLLPSLLKSAQLLARPPISNFSVGAVGLSSDGRVFFGANVEFKNLPLHHTIHAEQFLITNIAAHGGGPKVMNIAVSAAPCGHCRQFLQELRGVGDVQIVVIDDQGQGCEPVYEAFSAILPYPFGPCDLLDHKHPLILEKCSNEISLKDGVFGAGNGNEPGFGDGFRETIDKNEEFAGSEGFTAARGSHAPPISHVVSDSDILSNGFSELTKDEGFTAARGTHAPPKNGVVSDVNSLSNGFSELIKDEGFAAARGSHAPPKSSVVTDSDILSNGFSELTTDEGSAAARRSHAPPNSSVVTDSDILSNGFSELTKDEGFAAARGPHAPVESGDVFDTSDLSNGYSELIDENEELLKREAFAAARGSHAPYSGCPSGVALMDCEGKVYKGSYMESAACNPSMMPVQAAVVAYMVAGGGGYERIVAAVLVEKEEAVVRQEDTVRLILKNISPKCVLKVLHCY